MLAQVYGPQLMNAAYRGTRAVDIVSGERVLVQRYTDMEAFSRAQGALLAMRGCYAVGHGQLHQVPPFLCVG